MQTVANRHSNTVSSQTRSIAIFAVLLFALAGLISGFAFGAFVHPKTTSTTGNSGSNTKPPVVHKTQTPVSSKTIQPIRLGFPVINQADYFENADGSTPYTLSAYAVDTSKDAGHGNPIHVSGITCKLWLTKDGNVNAHMPSDRLRSVNSLQAPFPKEVSEALNFSTDISQVQSTNSDGQTTWKYTLPNSLHSGAYYLVVLMDWNGIHYNWSWIKITIKQAD